MPTAHVRLPAPLFIPTSWQRVPWVAAFISATKGQCCGAVADTATPASRQDAGSSPGCSTFMSLEKQPKVAQVLSICHTHGTPRWNSRFTAVAWPSPDYGDHVRSDSAKSPGLKHVSGKDQALRPSSVYLSRKSDMGTENATQAFQCERRTSQTLCSCYAPAHATALRFQPRKRPPKPVMFPSV